MHDSASLPRAVVGKSFAKKEDEQTVNMMGEMFEAVWGALFIDSHGDYARARFPYHAPACILHALKCIPLNTPDVHACPCRDAVQLPEEFPAAEPGGHLQRDRGGQEGGSRGARRREGGHQEGTPLFTFLAALKLEQLWSPVCHAPEAVFREVSCHHGMMRSGKCFDIFSELFRFVLVNVLACLQIILVTMLA